MTRLIHLHTALRFILYTVEVSPTTLLAAHRPAAGGSERTVDIRVMHVIYKYNSQHCADIKCYKQFERRLKVGCRDFDK